MATPPPVEVEVINEVEPEEQRETTAESDLSHAQTHLTPAVIIQSPTLASGGVDNPALIGSSDEENAVPAGANATADNNSAMDDAGPSRGGREPLTTRRVCGSAISSASDSDTADDAPLLHEGSVGIEIPEDKPTTAHDRFPKEKGKALFSVVLLVFAAVMNEIVLSFVHEKVPDTPPLPDVTFSNTPYFPFGLEICEYIMLGSFASMLILIVFHRHRWIMLRRLMIIGFLLYMMRCVTMFVTQVPVADKNFYCSPKMGENATFFKLVVRGLSMVAGLGLNFQGKTTLCGDYIYSGHTIVLVLSALFVSEYSPRRFWPLHLLSWMAALLGVIFLVISRGHYTIDVILSYFICTRVFWNYHTLAAHPTLRHSTHNHHSKEFWFPLFRFLEGNIQKPIPRRFDSPIPLEKLPILRRIRSSRIITNARIE